MISKLCLYAYKDPGSEGGKFAVLRTTGPLLWSRVVQDHEFLPSVSVSLLSEVPAVYSVFGSPVKHEGLSITYYGDLRTPVFRLKMMPDKEILQKELEAWLSV